MNLCFVIGYISNDDFLHHYILIYDLRPIYFSVYLQNVYSQTIYYLSLIRNTLFIQHSLAGTQVP